MEIAVSLPGQDGYFLFFRFRIATIRRPVVSIIMNSSYVLISFPPSARLGTGGAALSAALVSLLYCQSAADQLSRDIRSGELSDHQRAGSPFYWIFSISPVSISM